MSIDIHRHQAVVNSQGEKTSFIVPAEDYEQFLLLLDYRRQYEEMEVSLKSALDEAVKIKSGDAPRKSLQSLIDEL